jgi:hypothetical protein
MSQSNLLAMFARIFLPVWASLALSGCSGLNIREKLFPSDDDPKIPVRLVDVWSDEMLEDPNLPPVQGFGGRVMFYTQEETKPVVVEGKFVVYVFDEQDSDTNYTTPERTFVYPAEKLSKYYRKSELGHSYNFWVPWGEIGGPERKLVIIARFEPAKGAPILSKPCHKTLAGSPPRPGEPGSKRLRMTKRREDDEIQQVGYEEPVERPKKASRAAYEEPIERGKGASRPGYEEPVGRVALPRTEPRHEMTAFTMDVPMSMARPDTAPREPEIAGQSAGVASRRAASASNSSEDRSANARREDPRAEAPESSTSTRSSPSRFPAQRGATARARIDPVRKQPHPATWQSALPSTPRSDSKAPVEEWNEGDAPRAR